MTEPCKTTAIYPNRLADKERVESELGLVEFGDEETVFKSKAGTVLFIGYVRIVYGDHGPYVEFEKRHIKAQFRCRFNNPIPKWAFYEWLMPEDESRCKIYRQLRGVWHLKNPPKGGFMGNRDEGYADYVPGMYYVSPFDMVFEPNLKAT